MLFPVLVSENGNFQSCSLGSSQLRGQTEPQRGKIGGGWVGIQGGRGGGRGGGGGTSIEEQVLSGVLEEVRVRGEGRGEIL